MPRHLLRRGHPAAPPPSEPAPNDSPQPRLNRAHLDHIPAQPQFQTPPSSGIPQLHPSSGPIDPNAIPVGAPEPVRRAAAAQAALFSLFGRGVTGRPHRSSMIDVSDEDEDVEGSLLDDEDEDDDIDPDSVETDQGQLDLDPEAGNDVELSEEDMEGMVGEEIEEDEDELMHDREKSPSPLPIDLREISSLASWTVSTHKPGCGVAALRNPDHMQYWQSDGPQPHTLTLHFFKLVAIVKIRVFLDFGLDESYTPTKMNFLAGMGGNDLVEFATWEGEGPCGWVDVPLDGVGGQNGGWVRTRRRRRRHETGMERRHGASGVSYEAPVVKGTKGKGRGVKSKGKASSSSAAGSVRIWVDDSLSSEDQAALRNSRDEGGHPGDYLDQEGYDDTDNGDDDDDENDDDPYAGNVLKAMVLQMRIMENHQNGKDTHVRGFQVFARDDDRRRIGNAPSASADARIRRHSARKSLRGHMNDDDIDGHGDGHTDGERGKMTRSEEPDWMGDPVIR